MRNEVSSEVSDKNISRVTWLKAMGHFRLNLRSILSPLRLYGQETTVQEVEFQIMSLLDKLMVELGIDRDKVDKVDKGS